MKLNSLPESRARAGNFAPAVADVRAITIDSRFEQNDPSDEIPAYRVLDREEIAVPAPVLEHREQDVALLRDSREMSRLLDGNGERLVHHDISPGAHRQLGERRVRFIGARNYDEVDIRMRREHFRIGHDFDIGKDGRDICRPAGRHRCDQVAVCRLEQRHVKGLRHEAEANQADSNRIVKRQGAASPPDPLHGPGCGAESFS